MVSGGFGGAIQRRAHAFPAADWMRQIEVAQAGFAPSKAVTGSRSRPNRDLIAVVGLAVTARSTAASLKRPMIGLERRAHENWHEM